MPPYVVVLVRFAELVPTAAGSGSPASYRKLPSRWLAPSSHHCLVELDKARLPMVVYDDHASNHAAASRVSCFCHLREGVHRITSLGRVGYVVFPPVAPGCAALRYPVGTPHSSWFSSRED